MKLFYRRICSRKIELQSEQIESYVAVVDCLRLVGEIDQSDDQNIELEFIQCDG